MQENLHKWFNEEDWVRISSSGKIAGPCGTSKNKKNPDRCLPRAKAQSLSKNQRKATAAKKKSAGRTGKKNVSNTKKAKVTRESISNEKIVQSFKTKDSLAPKLYTEDNKLYPNIRERLITIANAFMAFLEMDVQVKDITLTGSLANYNWSSFSDIDLHIIVDFSSLKTNPLFIKSLFDSKKSIWNDTYEVNIKGYEVEVYVQDSKETHTSTGVYSLLTDAWLVEPKPREVKIDTKKILTKTREIQKRIDAIESSDDSDSKKKKRVDILRDKIKKFRRSGLEKGGEFSYENLTFKMLRRNGYLSKLLSLRDRYTSQILSLERKKGGKDDRCTRLAKQAYAEWPSAYASGAVVRCRKGEIWKDKK